VSDGRRYRYMNLPVLAVDHRKVDLSIWGSWELEIQER